MRTYFFLVIVADVSLLCINCYVCIAINYLHLPLIVSAYSKKFEWDRYIVEERYPPMPYNMFNNVRSFACISSSEHCIGIL